MQMTPYVLLNRFNVRFPFVDAVQLSLVIDIEGMSVFHYEGRDDCSFYIYCSNLLSIWIWHGSRALQENQLQPITGDWMCATNLMSIWHTDEVV